MLLEFRCQNHKSIRDEVVFSCIAGSETAHPENLRTVGQMRILHTAVIYGPNGSGKSNLLDALSCLCRTMLTDAPVRQTPHKLSADHPSFYQIQFLCDGLRYVYGIALLKNTVTKEYLYFFPEGRQVKIFSREKDDLSVGRRFHARLSAWKNVLRTDRPLLAVPAAASDALIAPALRFFIHTLVPYRLGEDMQVDETSLARAIAVLHASPHIRKEVCSILGTLGTGILDIRTDGEGAEAVYRDFTTDLRREESTGIRRLIGFLCPLAEMLQNGKVLLCDELEINLHEAVVRHLLNLLRRENGHPCTQLIFSTHNTALLDLSLFRRDQIWFTELRPDDRSTELYSLAEIRRVREDEDIRRAYMAGKYGGIPSVDSVLPPNTPKGGNPDA